jgi:hypothetical protein
MDKNNPFSSLIPVSSLIIATLYVAGFAYKWSYYYNFGIQSIVWDLNPQSFLITAIELVRVPENFLKVIFAILVPLLILNLLIKQSKQLFIINLRNNVSLISSLPRSIAFFIWKQLSLNSQFTLDLLRMLLILYTTYSLSSQIGYEQFKKDIVNSENNTLPIVSVIIETTDGNRNVISCGSKNRISWENTSVLGSTEKIRKLQQLHQTCSIKNTEWRLLYRNDKFIYLFASVSEEQANGRRPLTIILPNNDKSYLVLQ